MKTLLKIMIKKLLRIQNEKLITDSDTGDIFFIKGDRTKGYSVFRVPGDEILHFDRKWKAIQFAKGWK